MNEQRTDIRTVRQSRISTTGPLTFPSAALIAGEIVRAVKQNHYGVVAEHLGKVADADELLAVRDELQAQGVPFDTLFPEGEIGVYHALQSVLGRSDEAQLSLFSDSLTLMEMEALGHFEHHV